MTIFILILLVGISSAVLGYFVQNRIGAFACLITGMLMILCSLCAIVEYVDVENHSSTIIEVMIPVR